MKEHIREYILDLLGQIVTLDTELILLAVLIIVSIIVIDGVSYFARKKHEEIGLDKGATLVSVDGSDSLPVRNYISEMQGLSGRPDALIHENGFIIPVERKPLAKKVRDRHVAQLLVYMRLVEEFEGKRPPYGYLILGRNCRRFKIYNTEDRQAWLQRMIDEMMAHLEDAQPIQPAPHPRKCKKCNVREECQFRHQEANIVHISPNKVAHTTKKAS